MPKFYGYGETVITLINKDGDVIGTDYGHKPVYEIEAESLAAAEDADMCDWEFTGDSNGTIGADFKDGYDYDDVVDEIVWLNYVVDIYEN